MRLPRHLEILARRDDERARSRIGRRDVGVT